ncbi:MAG: aminotransferase class I/II-fold pyridoxal phosphate-dependent enzyme [Lachnospiraceae bacterium]|nr:aminotransferase class I/II-fold pyridoxal phosphate-dependent enzyme [Lachnospiraceae bacterium]
MNKKNPPFHGSDIENIAAYYQLSPDSIVNFGANVNPLGISNKVKEQIANHWEILSAYPERKYTRLRKTIASYCKVDMEHVMVGNGTSELIALLIAQQFPKKTLVLGPTYSEYERELSFSRSTIHYYNLCPKNNFFVDMDDFLKTIQKGYNLLILCNPNNPTASFLPKDNIAQILRTCRKHNTFVMIDETYIEFVTDHQTHSAMALVEQFDHLMILRGVSKFFAAPGLRLGYGISSNKHLIQQMKNAQIPWSLNSVAAYAGEWMLTDAAYIAETKKLIETEKKYLQTQLDNMSGVQTFGGAANFILVKIIKKDMTAKAVFEACIRAGLMIRDCSSFQNLQGEYVRFCVMKREDNERLVRVLQNILG